MKNIQKLLIICAAMCVLTGSCLAQVSKAPVQGLFWRATLAGNELDLIGSVHLGSKDMFPLPVVFENALKNASELVVEVDISKVDQKSTGALVQELGIYPAGDSLNSHLSPKTAKRLKAFCARYGFPSENLQRLKPWLAAVTISLIPMLKAGAKPDMGIDQYFLNEAKAQHLPVRQLESADWQLRLLSSVRPEDQEAYLASSLSGAEKAGENQTIMERDWIRGDAQALDDEVTREFSEPKELARRMREDRNYKMADDAERCLKSGKRSFFVVGAAHMIGKEGIVALLRRRGYHVQQIISGKATGQ